MRQKTFARIDYIYKNYILVVFPEWNKDVWVSINKSDIPNRIKLEPGKRLNATIDITASVPDRLNPSDWE
jgi:hypothetical protein